MLGLFENTLTLVNCVCDNCNQFFSRELELPFGRDSIFGIFYRGYVGLLNDERFNRTMRHSRERLETLLYHPDYFLIHVNLSLHETNGFQAKIADQFSILNSTKGKRINYRVEQLPHRSYLDSIGLSIHKDRFLFLGGMEDRIEKNNDLNNQLKQKGIKLILGSTLHRPNGLSLNTPLQFASVIDDAIIRTIAKIGFNYLAYFFDTSFILSEHFDEIRNYIRHGQKAGYDLVMMEYHEVKNNLKNLKKEMFGHHKIALFQANSKIIATITLFNRIVFNVTLTNSYPLWRPDLNRTNIFDILNRKITSTLSSKKSTSRIT